MARISRSAKERACWKVFVGVGAGGMTLKAASALLGLGYRQTKRSWSRSREEGDVGLVHRLRGKASNRQVEAGKQVKALPLYAEKYSDYGPTLATECLAADDGFHVPVETLRRGLLSSGLWSLRRKRKVHRRRRPRRKQFGELVQREGSLHAWFEGRRGYAVLRVALDDATGLVSAHFFERETLHAAWTTFRLWAEQYGLPGALYVERHRIYRSDRGPTAEELLSGQAPPTQFGRSMEALQVRFIKARSPQAKGRVERRNGTLQDRWQNRFLQLPREPASRVQPGMQVTVCALLEGSLRMLHGETELLWSATRSVPARSSQGVSRPCAEIRSSQGRKPAAHHPWRGRGRPERAEDSQAPEWAGSVPGSRRASSTTPVNSEFS